MFESKDTVLRHAIGDSWDSWRNGRVELLEEGYGNSLWLVSTPAGVAVAKLSDDDTAHFEAGLRAAEIVHQKTALITGHPLRTGDNRLTVPVRINGKAYSLALLSPADGTAMLVDGVDPEKAGIALGKVHRALAGESITGGWTLSDDIDYLEAPPAGVPSDLEWVVRRAKNVASRVRALPSLVTYAAQPLHGNGPELRVGYNGDVTAVLDWTDARYAPVLTDIACWTAQYRDCSASDFRRKTEGFLKGYATVASLSAAQRDAVPLFQELRAVCMAMWRVQRVMDGDNSADLPGVTNRSDLNAWRQWLDNGISGPGTDQIQ